MIGQPLANEIKTRIAIGSECKAYSLSQIIYEVMIMNQAPSPRLLTITETAACLGCSEANVYALINAGKLPYVPVGKRKGYRVSVEDVQTFIEARKVQKQPTETKPNYRPRLRHIRL